MGFQALHYFVELHSQEHEVLVNAIVIDFVPVEVADVEEGLEPDFLLIKVL